tara:strand:- start:2655 stop:3191 length:537 start_codon:yes stop_codon:yes gene_type:complete
LGPSIVEKGMGGGGSLASWTDANQWNYPSGGDDDDALALARASPGLGLSSSMGSVGDLDGSGAKITREVDDYGATSGGGGQVLFPEWMEDENGGAGVEDGSSSGGICSCCNATTVRAVPLWMEALSPCDSPSSEGGVCSCGCWLGWTTLGVMTALTLATLSLDVFFLFKGIDLVDNPT